jgi:hypothetical protein
MAERRLDGTFSPSRKVDIGEFLILEDEFCAFENGALALQDRKVTTPRAR